MRPLAQKNIPSWAQRYHASMASRKRSYEDEKTAQGSKKPRHAPAICMIAAAAVLYGQFIAAAYAMHDAAPTNTNAAAIREFPCRISAGRLGPDARLHHQQHSPDLLWFIAQSETDPICIVLAIRGTSSWVEWWDDLNAIRLEPFKDPGAGSGRGRFRPHLRYARGRARSNGDAVATRHTRRAASR